MMNDKCFDLTNFPNINGYINDSALKNHDGIIGYCIYIYTNNQEECWELIAEFLKKYEYYEDFCCWGRCSRWKNAMIPCIEENFDDFKQMIMKCACITRDINVVEDDEVK